jgi:hypothetical protein
MKSSVGYHTISLYRKLSINEAELLLRIFENRKDVFITKNEYSSETGTYRFNYYNIEYLDRQKGIKWILKAADIPPGVKSRFNDEYKPCSIKVTINPKIFAGIKDYVSTSTYEHLQIVETNFNREASRISPILGAFGLYTLNRIDYCFNFDLKELCLNCTPEQMMTLIKRANIPAHFVEWKEYDKTSHRMESGKYSFYLKSKSVIVNCYWKNYQMQKEFPDFPNIEDSIDVIRFEIQCKYPKVYYMSRVIKNDEEYENIELINAMLSDDISENLIRKYIDRVIRRGDYYPLEAAKELIRSKNYQKRKEGWLIETLELINRCRGISKAKAELRSDEYDEFKRGMRVLEAIGINPVMIPREWGIKHISNLFNAYFFIFSVEKVNKIAKGVKSKKKRKP